MKHGKTIHCHDEVVDEQPLKYPEMDPDTSSLDEKLLAVRFDLSNIPPDEPPVMWISDVEVAHPGNIVVVEGQNKSGKSAFYAAGIASIIGENVGDCLGWRSNENPKKHAVIHIDSEQSRGDHHKLICRTLKRANLKEKPAYFDSFCLTGWDIEEAKQALHLMLQNGEKNHGGVHSVFIDGGADFLKSVNDETESIEWIKEMQALAIRYLCPVFVIIHLNPSSGRMGSLDKSRGHFGSQIDRKAETVLTIKMEEDVSTVSTRYSRRAPIPKDSEPQFRFNAEEGMHSSLKVRKDAKLEKRRKDLESLTEDIFRDHNSAFGMTWSDLGGKIASLKSINGKEPSHSTIERRIKEITTAALIKKMDDGSYKRNF
jgi:hypothetical protein